MPDRLLERQPIRLFCCITATYSQLASPIKRGGFNMANFVRWEWIIFFAPLGLAVFVALFAAFGLGEHDADADADTEADTDTDVHSDGDGHESLLSLIGVGKAPLSLVTLSLLLLWATAGLAGNLLWGTERIWLSLLVAGIAALVGTRAAATLFARLIPSVESHHVERNELIGCEGTALYPISDSAGTVRLYDRLRNLRQLDSRTYGIGAGIIPEGTTIVVMEYDKERQVFLVAPLADVLPVAEELP
jgi:membrane protein implicated in regulation of membrane protease activity